MANRLAGEKSPYLLQHAKNPVDWYPWGPEAFARAKKEDKPLLLSIGYSTCHWCHVMEHESFADPAIAAVMNEHFVCVKLDREERPDVDKVYMTAVQAMTGRGGWPLNVFLTPDLKPFFGGTYFPPEPRWGQPGWLQLIKRIGELWRERRQDILADAEKLAAAIRELSAPAMGAGQAARDLLVRALKGLEESFDPMHAGFGGAPKFPMPGYLSLLLRLHSRGHQEAKRLALETLRAMAAGGLFDQVGGGFHRYSTDSEWRVPHFEKMLYDNAQLASVYVEAYQAFGTEDLAAEARATLDYMLRDLAHPEGGFCSAEDADSLPAGEEGGETREGAFYLWTHAELCRLLGDDAPLFCYRFGCRPDGNAVADPHGEFDGANILYRARTLEQAAAKFGLEPAAADKSLKAALAKLLQVRAKRSRPALDDKILASWNGLAISALAKAGGALGETRYLDAARKAASFIKDKLWDEAEGRLWHRYRDGERAVAGMADDYVLLGLGLVDLYEGSLEPEWLAWSVRLMEAALTLFFDKAGGVFLTAEGDAPELIARVIDDSDGVEPCASSAAALLLSRLAAMTGRRDFGDAAGMIFRRFASRLYERPLSLSVMLCALDFSLDKPLQLIVAGAPAAALWAEARKRFLPRAVFLGADPVLSTLAPWASGLKPPGGKPAAFVCVDGACQRPVTEPARLAELLDAQ